MTEDARKKLIADLEGILQIAKTGKFTGPLKFADLKNIGMLSAYDCTIFHKLGNIRSKILDKSYEESNKNH